MSLIKEIQRYLGYKGPVDTTTQELILEKLNEMKSLSSGRYVYQAFNIKSINEEEIIFEDCSFSLKGKSLARHLKGSIKCYLMAATLGQKIDRMIQLNTLRSPSEGLITDAVGSALIEEICDNCEEEIKLELSDRDHLVSRFSPGYGDLSLEYHPTILKLLQAHKKIGLTSNESHLLIPLKSVVAIIGVREYPSSKDALEGCGHNTCDICSLQNDCHLKKYEGNESFETRSTTTI
jgi:hypothetical protein